MYYVIDYIHVHTSKYCSCIRRISGACMIRGDFELNCSKFNNSFKEEPLHQSFYKYRAKSVDLVVKSFKKTILFIHTYIRYT